MTMTLNARAHIACALVGVAGPVLLFIGLWPLADFFPPHLPSASAAEIAAIYQQHSSRIIAGMFFVMLGVACYAPFVAAISSQMRRIENSATPVLSYAQLATGAPIALFIITPAMIWATAAYRPHELDPTVTRMLNDMGWFFFVMPFTLGFLNYIILGAAILIDRNPKPVFPRWLAYLNFWVAALIVPAGIIPFFKDGPFAWNGAFGFWIPAFVFGNWFFVMAIFVVRAARTRASSDQPRGLSSAQGA